MIFRRSSPTLSSWRTPCPISSKTRDGTPPRAHPSSSVPIDARTEYASAYATAGRAFRRRSSPELFEPFYRPDHSRTRQKGGGTGLGLSLVRRIAELHGAPPDVSSKLGEGSTFGFSLPVA